MREELLCDAECGGKSKKRRQIIHSAFAPMRLPSRFKRRYLHDIGALPVGPKAITPRSALYVRNAPKVITCPKAQIE